MLSIYPAIFYENNDGGYAVIFPDLNHLSTCGKNLNEAMSMAIDCLAGYLYEEKLARNTLPTPTPIDKIDIHCEDDEDDDYIHAFVNIISVDVNDYAKLHFAKSIKKTLTIPKWLNDIAVSKNINFSKSLQAALIEKLNIDSSQIDIKKTAYK